jgi:hypothetical protein
MKMKRLKGKTNQMGNLAKSEIRFNYFVLFNKTNK